MAAATAAAGPARFIAGIDCGSAYCKGALIRDHGPGTAAVIERLETRPSGWDLAGTGALVMKALLDALPPGCPPEAVPLVTTGYGRERVDNRLRAVSEITAHARGASFLCPGIRTLIDIGGQDCKVIAVEAGRPTAFLMNDKCAAGTGRFMETVCRRLGVEAAALDALLAAGRAVTLNSLCAVFAETEITGLLAQGVSREEILGGAAALMASRSASLAARLSPVAPAALSGGFSRCAGIAAALSTALGIPVRPLANGAFAGAIGAALSGGR